MSKPRTDTQFTFTDTDTAACDAVIEEHRRDTMEALPAWLKKAEELHPDWYESGDPDEVASQAAWGFFESRCEALGLKFDFGGEEDS